MRRAVLVFMITVLAAGYAMAADTQNANNQQKPTQTFSRPPRNYMTGKYTRMLNNLISGALDMDITNDQKKSVTSLREKYIAPLAEAENGIRQAHIDILKMLNDPSFNPMKVKKEVDTMTAQSKKVADDYIDGLASLRDIIGKDKFETLNRSQVRYQNDLVQMRNRGMRRSSPPSSDMNRTGYGQQPVKTGAPTRNSGN
jgi:hypothetical protein